VDWHTLTTWEGVEVDDSINTLGSARVHNTINELEAAIQDLVGFKVVHQVAMT